MAFPSATDARRHAVSPRQPRRQDGDKQERRLFPAEQRAEALRREIDDLVAVMISIATYSGRVAASTTHLTGRDERMPLAGVRHG